MYRIAQGLLSLALVASCQNAQSEQPAPPPAPEVPDVVEISFDDLRDKIRGGWAAQTIGVTFGGPTEFRYNGTMIQPYEPIPWYDGYLLETFTEMPGLYDDIYMDITFVEVLEKEGLDASPVAFGKGFAEREYKLWHANQMARYNIRNGIEPPASGHWLNNPEADSIDFQIEADFAGLMSPGMPNAAAEISDRVGHTMNHGDGWYGGVYVAALYALAFVSDDVPFVVSRALEVIPKESTFHQTISDVIRWHREYPDDWRDTWFEIEKKWSADVGSPHGDFQAFNIDAKYNAAFVALGLLYGEGDFGKTLDVAARAGADSDCNPATAAGVLGVMFGYDAIPAEWTAGLAAIEPLDFAYTTTSLEEVYELSFEHALRWVERHGAEIGEDSVRIPIEAPRAVRLEQNFVGHYPVEELRLRTKVQRETSFAFDGIGFATKGEARSTNGRDHVLELELHIDSELVETFRMPTSVNDRRFIPVWRYQLDPGHHEARLVITNPTEGAYLWLDYAIIYADSPR